MTILDEYTAYGEMTAEEIEQEGLYNCSRCFGEALHPCDLSKHIVNGEDVCADCASCCPMCGEWIEDESAHLGPEVRFREWSNDGRLSDPHHAICAADSILEAMSGERWFSTAEKTREEIAEAVGCGR